MGNQLMVVGLTGGIASGKSTVAGFLRKAGMPVIDADQLGQLVLEPGNDAHLQVVEAFGKDILDYDDQIDRKKLGDKVFDNPARRKALEEITHPAIAKLAKRGLEMIHERGEPLAFYEAALLVETEIYKNLAHLVVVSCSVATQIERIMARDGFTKEAAAMRIAAQYPLEEKLKVANYVINTECSLETTESETLDVLSSLKNRLMDN